jgi:hypothetical protein
VIETGLPRPHASLEGPVLAAEIDQLIAEPTLADRDGTALRMRLNSVVQRCQDGVDLLLDLNGASSFALDNPLQRFWRDLHVGSRHVQFNPYLAVGNARTEAGGTPSRHRDA